jgi:hypothetical protein
MAAKQDCHRSRRARPRRKSQRLRRPPQRGNPCPRPANRDTTQDAGAIAEPCACRALALERIAGAADQLPLPRPAQGGRRASAPLGAPSTRGRLGSAPRRQAVTARLSKPARAFMTAFGESCRRRGHAGASVTDPLQTPVWQRSIRPTPRASRCWFCIRPIRLRAHAEARARHLLFGRASRGWYDPGRSESRGRTSDRQSRSG